MTIPPYPLHWPQDLPRTERKAHSQFRTSLSAAINNVRKSLAAFGTDTGKPVADVAVTSNVGGIALEPPKDTGVAIWFEWDGAPRCIAVDRYPKAEDNLQAIHHILEARRTEMRHGGLHIVRQTFSGFVALPEPKRKRGHRSWHEVLGVSPAATEGEIKIAWRKLAAEAHPDRKGGSGEDMAAINAARDEGLRNLAR